MQNFGLLWLAFKTAATKANHGSYALRQGLPAKAAKLLMGRPNTGVSSTVAGAISLQVHSEVYIVALEGFVHGRLAVSLSKRLSHSRLDPPGLH